MKWPKLLTEAHRAFRSLTPADYYTKGRKPDREIAEAQVAATLALAEQQWVANMIALQNLVPDLGLVDYPGDGTAKLNLDAAAQFGLEPPRHVIPVDSDAYKRLLHYARLNVGGKMLSPERVLEMLNEPGWGDPQ